MYSIPSKYAYELESLNTKGGNVYTNQIEYMPYMYPFSNQGYGYRDGSIMRTHTRICKKLQIHMSESVSIHSDREQFVSPPILLTRLRLHT